MVTVRWTITWLAVASSTACFTKPDRPADPVADGPPTATPRIVADNHGNNGNTSTMTLMIRIPPGDGLFLLAAVQAGVQCSENVPTVIEVNADGVPLTQIANIVGTPCGGGSRSEQWTLVPPPVGDPVAVTFVLDGPATSLHAMAFVLDGVDQAAPVRGSETKNGQGIDSTIAIDSAAGDLVIDTIGQGGAIMGPGVEQDLVFSMNQSANTTLDNSGASRRPGVDGRPTTMTWNFDLNDEWQTIATSIRPL